MSLKDFQVLNRLGEGSYSSVYKVKRLSDGQEYAMKKVKLAALSDKEKQNALNEVRLLASIKSPHVIGYKEAFLEDNSMTLCIVMEYAGGGDIYGKIQNHIKSRTYFKEEEIWKLIAGMVQGLKVLHDMKILHRDLKCANVFLSKEGFIAKLGDLNVSKVAKNALVYTQTGTPYYASPEVWRDQPYDGKSDIWSLGCVIYEACALKPPFRANDMQGLYKKVQRGVFDRIPSQYSIDLYNIISMCLQTSPAMRPSCNQLLKNTTFLKHCTPYLEEIPKDIIESQDLMHTIKVPKNMKALNQQLPKASYEGQSVSNSVDLKAIQERNVTSGYGKRAVSQNVPLNGPIMVRGPGPQSRESKISYLQKVNPSQQMGQKEKETEKEYLERLQKDFINNAKVIKPNELLRQNSGSEKANGSASKNQYGAGIKGPVYKQNQQQIGGSNMNQNGANNLVKKSEVVVGRQEPVKKLSDYLIGQGGANKASKIVDYSKVNNYNHLNEYRPIGSREQQHRPVNSRDQVVRNMILGQQQAAAQQYGAGSQSRVLQSAGNQQVRPLNSREQNRPSHKEVLGNNYNHQPYNKNSYLDRQEYIINKYHQDAHRAANNGNAINKYGDKYSDQKILQRVYNNEKSMAMKKGEAALHKYQNAYAENVGHRVSPAKNLQENIPLRGKPPISNNGIGAVRQSNDAMDRLKAQYNSVGQQTRVQSAYKKVDYPYSPGNYGVKAGQNYNSNSNNNNYHQIQQKQQQPYNYRIQSANTNQQRHHELQSRGVQRPSWWG